MRGPERVVVARGRRGRGRRRRPRVAAGSVATVCDVTWCGPGVSLLCLAVDARFATTGSVIASILIPVESSRLFRPLLGSSRPNTATRDEEANRPRAGIFEPAPRPRPCCRRVVGARASGPVFMLRLHLAGTCGRQSRPIDRGRQVRARTTGEGCSQSHRTSTIRSLVIVCYVPFRVA